MEAGSNGKARVEFYRFIFVSVQYILLHYICKYYISLYICIYIYGVWFYIIQAFVQESFFRPQCLLKLAVVVQPQGITARLLHRCITWRPSSQRLLGQLPLNIFNTTSTSGSTNKLYIQGPQNLLGYFGFKNRYVSSWQMCFFYIPSPFSLNSLQQPCWENVSEGQHDWQRVSSGLPATNHLFSRSWVWGG